jgi:hypothetical protein
LKNFFLPYSKNLFMQKVFTTLFMVAIFLNIISCKKDSNDNNNTNNNPPSNGWKLGATSYNAVQVVKLNDRSMAAFDSIPNNGTNPTNANSCLIRFGTAPTANGTYKIIGATASSIGANEISVSAKLKNNINSYISTGTDNINATITITNGKLKVAFPDVWVKQFGTTDSVKLSASLTEQ